MVETTSWWKIAGIDTVRRNYVTVTYICITNINLPVLGVPVLKIKFEITPKV